MTRDFCQCHLHNVNLSCQPLLSADLLFLSADLLFLSADLLFLWDRGQHDIRHYGWNVTWLKCQATNVSAWTLTRDFCQCHFQCHVNPCYQPTWSFCFSYLLDQSCFFCSSVPLDRRYEFSSSFSLPPFFKVKHWIWFVIANACSLVPLDEFVAALNLFNTQSTA